VVARRSTLQPHQLLRTVARRAGLVTGFAVATVGCSAYLQNIAQWKPAHRSDEDEIVLYGGPDHATYLGCVNCSRYDSESVLNTEGPYGRYDSSTSIANPSSVWIFRLCAHAASSSGG
jgi:hypothetical protein